MRVLIADDESLARARLRELITEIGGYTIVGEATNGEQALLMGTGLRADIILMDIRMPGMDGLEAALHFCTAQNPPAVIFTTAYGDYALAAFDAHAVDYLLKPIRQERLRSALGRAQQLTHNQLSGLQTGPGARARTHISALVHGNIKLVPVAEIAYFKADQKYVAARFPAGQVLIEDSLTALETEFGARFLRIHRNALVARAGIAGLEKDTDGNLMIKLRGIDEQLEISRRHAPMVRQCLKDYIA
ncbi:MAG: LytTR family DNA-binding domain-containing protein [Gammaproteobacteria bacterium]